MAVEISEEAKRAAAAVSARLKRELGDSLNARWIAAENMHLTVRFVGHVPDERVPALLAALAPPLDLPAFDIVLGPCGVFPRSGPPRVIWLGVAEGLPGLAAMHDDFDRRLAPFGFEPESRLFSPHLTLARVKDRASAAVRRVVGATVPAPVRSRITAATTFQSHLSPKGATYEALARAGLATDQHR